jgi:hypothetical protein
MTWNQRGKQNAVYWGTACKKSQNSRPVLCKVCAVILWGPMEAVKHDKSTHHNLRLLVTPSPPAQHRGGRGLPGPRTGFCVEGLGFGVASVGGSGDAGAPSPANDHGVPRSRFTSVGTSPRRPRSTAPGHRSTSS